MIFAKFRKEFEAPIHPPSGRYFRSFTRSENKIWKDKDLIKFNACCPKNISIQLLQETCWFESAQMMHLFKQRVASCTESEIPNSLLRIRPNFMQVVQEVWIKLAEETRFN
jgi:hypothetical protein